MLEKELSNILSVINSKEDNNEKLRFIDETCVDLEGIVSKLKQEYDIIKRGIEKKVFKFQEITKGQSLGDTHPEEDEVTHILNGQKEIDKKIKARAKELSPTLCPIWDGICDENIADYIKEGRIMWILKEPYADFDEKGNPKCDEGYAIYQGLKDKDSSCSVTGTQRNMIYVTQGIRTGEYWEDMGQYDKYMDNLKYIAFINISKMPAYSTSGDMAPKYDKWKEIVHEQLKLYKPKVIICGYTLDYLWDKEEYFRGFELASKGDSKNYDGWVTVYKKGDVLLLDAYHPGMKGQKYVDALIKAVRENR